MLKFRNSHLRALPLMGLNNSGLHVPGISISQCPQKCGECCSLLDNPHSALSYPAIFTRIFFFFFFYMTQSYLQLQAQAVYKQLQHQLCPSCHYRLYPTVLRYRPPLYLHAHLLLQSVWCLCHYRMGLKGTHIEMLVKWYEHCYHLSYLEHICSEPNSSRWLQKLLASNWHVRSLSSFAAVGQALERTTQVKLWWTNSQEDNGQWTSVAPQNGGEHTVSFSCYDISVYSLHMPLELAISNYSVT